MKITYIITGLGMGGAENQVCNMADKMNEYGHSVEIICLSGDVVVSPISEKIKIHNLHLKKNLVGFIKALIKTKIILFKTKPDIVHSHMFHANIFSRLLRVFPPFNSSALISTVHNSYEGGKVRMLCYRVTDFLTDITTNVSEEAVNSYLEKKAVKHGRIIPFKNAIDTDRYIFSEVDRVHLREKLNVNDQTKIILSIGRLTKQKDYPNLFNAISGISNEHILLVIIGDGELFAELRALAVNLNIDHKINWVGIQHNVQQWLSAADVFVLSSEWEGFGLVVAEAMSCERVVVATDSGGVAEVLGDRGFLVPVKNHRELGIAIENSLALSNEEAHELGNSARKRVKKFFSIENRMLEWLQLYESLKLKKWN
ncbi:glycosyltransferase [Erwinia rhapontici]|uniref:glycosyltransferase n=1 Tax=Erwinia rhapontici TaxID=55212 RepID=UPI0014385E30|nr:glycosyltransferase [Erwinia rhapontici]NKG29778.1 glycosyltransferase [Erwinia rhapontici]